MLHHVLGHAAVNQVRHSSAAVGGHHDQVHSESVGFLPDYLRDVGMIRIPFNLLLFIHETPYISTPGR